MTMTLRSVKTINGAPIVLDPLALHDDDVEEIVHALAASRQGLDSCRIHVLVGPPTQKGDAAAEKRERVWWRNRGAITLAAGETVLNQFETCHRTVQGPQRVLISYVAKIDALVPAEPDADETHRRARALVDAMRQVEKMR